MPRMKGNVSHLIMLCSDIIVSSRCKVLSPPSRLQPFGSSAGMSLPQVALHTPEVAQAVKLREEENWHSRMSNVWSII